MRNFIAASSMILASTISMAQTAPAVEAPRTEVAVQVKPDTLTDIDVIALEKANIRLVRFGIYYHPHFDTEGPTAREWDRYDRIFQILGRHHIKVLMTAFVPPALLEEQIKDVTNKEDAPSVDKALVRRTLEHDLDSLVMNVLKRYGPSIAAIELWNEPDNKRFWNASQLGPYPEAMSGICAVAKKWPIQHLYGYGYMFLPGGDTVTTPLYQEMEKHGAMSCLEGVSGHFYREKAEQITDEAAFAREFTGKPILITELGASSLSSTRTELQQADLITRMILSAVIARVPMISIYEWKDTPDAIPEREKHFGVLNSDSRPKPIYVALSTFQDIYLKSHYKNGFCHADYCYLELNSASNIYIFVWSREDIDLPLDTVIQSEEIETKLVRSPGDYYTSSAKEITITRSPLLVKISPPQPVIPPAKTQKLR